MTRDDLVRRLTHVAGELHDCPMCEPHAETVEAAAAALAAPPAAPPHRFGCQCGCSYAAPPADLVALGDRLRTQDNQMTAHPIFVVEHRDDKRRPWEFVTACLTDDGARSYMKANGHNLRKCSRIFVHSGYRNDEWIGLRNYLLSLHAAPRVPDTPQGCGHTALLQQTAAALWDLQHEPDCWCAYSGGSGPTGHTEACAQARVVNEKLKTAGVQHWPPQEPPR